MHPHLFFNPPTCVGNVSDVSIVWEVLYWKVRMFTNDKALIFQKGRNQVDVALVITSHVAMVTVVQFT